MLTHFARIGAVAVLLAGCAAQPGMQEKPGKGAFLSSRLSISYHGRFAVRYEQNGKPRNAYGHFNWHEQSNAITLQLLNPFGQTLAVVKLTSLAATLQLPNQPPQTATDIETLMQNTLGFALPVTGLHFWLQPSPSPSSQASIQIDPQTDRLTEIKQDGWTINYPAYAAAPGHAVKRVNLTRDRPPLEIKLVLD